MVVSSPYATPSLEGEAFDLYEVMNTFPPESAFPTFTGIYGLFGASERMGEVRVYRRNGGCSDIGGEPSRGMGPCQRDSSSRIRMHSRPTHPSVGLLRLSPQTWASAPQWI